MKKYLVILLMLAASTAVESSLFSIDFETSEGYPSRYPEDGTNIRLYDHGWYDTSSAWYVPYTNSSNPSDAFAYTGTRSAKVIAMSINQNWTNYAAQWTPLANETRASFSSHIAFQKYEWADGKDSYGGIVLRGKKANSTEVTLGGIQLCTDGTVTTWSYPNGIYASAASGFTYTLNSWYQLGINADFGSDTVRFFLDGNSVSLSSFGSDVVELSSIALYCGTNDPWSSNYVRYDNILVNIPEPCTLLLLGVGGLIMRRKAQGK